ncbi:MAG: type II toxin-antitoxin system VapC family toxin [Iamia sp.]
MPVPDQVLVDTHALLWWQAGSDRLSPAARRAVEDAGEVLVSPISCWEVAMLVEKGRVELDRPIATWVNDLLRDQGPARVAPLTPSLAVAAGSLKDFHGDPADRLIFATARSGAYPLVTKDGRMRVAAVGRGVEIVW